MSRLLAAAVAGILFVLLAPEPARADPARPTNYVSEITSVDPDVDGLEVDVVGGDAFLTVEVVPGTVAEVPGYEGEPYVRISAEGEVTVNINSPSHWVNEDRFGQIAVPSGATAGTEPEWVTVGTKGAYGWHDHRIHWMSPDPPPAVERSHRSQVFDWVVPLVVDGDAVQVHGTLTWLPARSAFPGLAILVVAGLAAYRYPKWLILLAGAGATAIGVGQTLDSPLGPGPEVLAWLPPFIAVVTAVAAFVWQRQRPTLLALAAVLLLVWGGIRFTALWLPVLPSPLPTMVERAAVAVAVGGAAGALITVYRALGHRALPGAGH